MKIFKKTSGILLTLLLVVFTIQYTHAQNSFVGKTPYVTQMHIHGWSNHNGAAKPGSLQYHNWQADSVGIDVIWWSEHHGLFEQDTMAMILNGATINPVSLDIENIPYNDSGELNHWECLVKQGNPSASIVADTLNLSLTAPVGTSPADTFAYAPRSLAGLVKDIAFSKPMVSKPVLQFHMNPAIPDANDTQIQLVFRLSWHYRQQQGQDVLIYKFVPSFVLPGVTSNNVDSVTVTVPVSNGWQPMELDLWDAAAVLDHGVDNTISDVELRMLARMGSTVSASFCDFNLVPLYYESDSIIFGQKNVIDDYSANYHAHNILGVEYSGFQHLNAYFPKSENNHQIFEGKIYGSVYNWVNKVHIKGGLVSYNHMFGTNWDLDSDSMQEYRSDTAATFMLSNQAYDADIIEVGYVRRGGGDFSRHLKTWDKLTANSLFLYGNGVSDAHGNEWMNEDDLFHTYIWSTDSSDYELLAALSAGKMFFGNQKHFKGEFYYTLGNLEMGDRGFINQNNVQPVIHLSPFPAGCKIKLTQILLNSSLTLNYFYNETIIDTFAIPSLDVSSPCFIRIGVYDINDNPLVFGQPIVILGLQSGVPEINYDGGIGIKIFPNPADEKLNLELAVNDPGNYIVQLFDMNSRRAIVVDEKYFYRGKHGYSVDISKLRSGQYILDVSGNNRSAKKKFVVK